MADISKCEGVGCDIKESCYRFMVPAGIYQTYFVSSPKEDDGCEFFWDNKDVHKTL